MLGDDAPDPRVGRVVGERERRRLEAQLLEVTLRPLDFVSNLLARRPEDGLLRVETRPERGLEPDERVAGVARSYPFSASVTVSVRSPSVTSKVSSG
ncbi:hypothetical protein ACFQL4_23435 [Halosimplex aquaticum]